MTDTTQTPAPGGAEKIQASDAQDSAAGAVLSPPADLPGGRAEELSAADLAVLGRAASEAAAAFAAAEPNADASNARGVYVARRAAEEFVSRVDAALVTLDQQAEAEGVSTARVLPLPTTDGKVLVQRSEPTGANKAPENLWIDSTPGEDGKPANTPNVLTADRGWTPVADLTDEERAAAAAAGVQ